MSRIGRRTRRFLARAESQEAIRVSPVNLFELTALHALGRVRLTRSPEQWIRNSLEAGGIRIAALSPEAAIDAGCIPGAALSDPLDRLLVAWARQLGATFATSDARILDYASRSGTLRVHDASA